MRKIKKKKEILKEIKEENEKLKQRINELNKQIQIITEKGKKNQELAIKIEDRLMVNEIKSKLYAFLSGRYIKDPDIGTLLNEVPRNLKEVRSVLQEINNYKNKINEEVFHKDTDYKLSDVKDFLHYHKSNLGLTFNEINKFISFLDNVSKNPKL